MGKMKALLGDVSYDDFIKESEMDKKEWKGTVYRSQDYRTPRTSREAFGMQVRDEDFVTFSHGVGDSAQWDKVIGVVSFVGLIFYVVLIFWGV